MQQGRTRTPNVFTPRTTTPGATSAPGTFDRSGRRGGVPGSVTTPGAGQPGTPSGVPGRVPAGINGRGPRGGTPGINQPGRGPGRTPGQGPGGINQGGNRGPGGQGRPGRGGQGGRDQGRGPGNARDQWNQNWNRHHGNWNHNGDWHHNNNWWWNGSSFLAGFFFYPLFASAFNYGYWGWDSCGDYCSYSPFYSYGFPYVYAPRVAVADVPDYTYAPVPSYDYGSGYYMSQGSYSGLDAAISDIRNAWMNGRADLMLKHVDANTQIAIYLDNNYSYSLPGSDYSGMVRDAIGRIKTVSLTLDNVEQRSDGAFAVSGVHEFYDVNNNRKVVNVSFTLAQQGGNWVLVSAGSSENT